MWLREFVGKLPPGRLGAGITIGEPIGASLKYWFNDTLAIDGAIGWSSHDDTDLYVHSDVCGTTSNLTRCRKAICRFTSALADWCGSAMTTTPTRLASVCRWDCRICSTTRRWTFSSKSRQPLTSHLTFEGEVTGGIGIRYWF